MKYLVVVAHPDDEILGAGASIIKWSNSGNDVLVYIASSGAEQRTNKPSNSVLLDNIKEANALLGIKHVYMGNYHNLEMNCVPHVELVQSIESILKSEKPDVVITHHPSDVNNDHFQVSMACQAAFRIHQRVFNNSLIKELLFMEVQSSTDWNVNPSFNPFKPNLFVEVTETGLEKKIEALEKYIGVMRPYPHPRSQESIKALATYRGSQSGLFFAEAFEIAFLGER